MQRLSILFKDRPMTARQTAFWWTEFVLRYENTNEFLQPPSVHQSWWVKRQIDVWLVAIALLLIITIVPLYTTYKILKYVLCSTSGADELQYKKLENGKKYN